MSSRATPVRVIAALVLAVALVCAPGGMDSAFGGAPLTVAGRVALSFLFCVAAGLYFFPLRRPPGRWLLVALVALVAVKLGVGRVAIPHGWYTSYQFGDTKGTMHAAPFFWQFGRHSYRIEPEVLLSDTHSNLHFFNDIPLYGYPPYSPVPRDIIFPMQVMWTGHLDATAPRQIVVVAEGIGKLTITTATGSKVWDDARAVRQPLRLAPGPQWVSLTYFKAADQAPAMKASVLDEETGTGLSVTPRPSEGRRWGGAGVTTAIVLGGLALLVAAVVDGYVRSGTSAAPEIRLVGAAAWAATIVLVGWGTSLGLAMHWHTRTLAQGSDPLAYGAFARDILHNGVLMLQGLPIGQAAPFYFYPFYPYVLAAAHVLVGEDMGTILLVNGWLLALLPPLFFALGWKQLSGRAGAIAFAALAGFVYFYTKLFVTFPDPVFTDFMFLTMVFVALNALARALERPTPVRLVAAGVAMALGAATRPSLMTLFYLTPFALWFVIGRTSIARWLMATGWVAAGVFLGLLPFSIRNQIASGQFVMLVNSWIQIPYFLVPPEVLERPGGFPSLGQAIVMAKDIFVAHPMTTIHVEVRKVLYTLGYTDAGPSGFDRPRMFMLLSALFFLAIGTRRVRGPLAVALVTFAVSHLAAMVVAAPWTFHYKAILPLHAAFLFASAFLLDWRPWVAAPAAAPPPADP